MEYIKGRQKPYLKSSYVLILLVCVIVSISISHVNYVNALLDKSKLSEYWKMDESSGFPINYANQTGSTSACAPFTSPTTGNPAGVFYGQSGIVNKAIGFQIGGSSKNTGSGTADSMSGNTEYGIQWTGLQPNSLYNTGTMVFTRSESGNMKLGIYDSTGKLLASSASTPISGTSVSVTTTSPATVPNDGILIFGWLSDSSHLPAGPSGSMASNSTSYPTLINQNHFVFNTGILFQNSISYSGSVLQGGQQMKSSSENCGNAQFSTYPNSIFSTGNTTVNLWVKRNQTSSIAQEGGKMTTFCSADNQSVYNGVCLQINKNLSVSYFRNVDTGSGGSMIDNMTSTANFFPNDTSWHMLSAIHILKSGASSSYTLFYIDGGNVYNATGGSTTNPALPSVSTSTQGIMSLGRTTNCANECNYLWGLLDEISLWWRSLNSNEVSQLWNGGNGASLLISTVQLRPDLSDNSTQLTSAKVMVTNSSTSQTITANSTGWVKFTGLSGNQNFTIYDDKNFVAYKIINMNVVNAVTKQVATNDTPFNCIGAFTGYQSDFIIRINDTDGHHITSMTTPTCPNQNQLKFSVTYTANGQSGNSFSSSMITTVGNAAYQANPSSFTVSGTTVPTTYSGGNNIISNSFSIGSGLSTFTKDFIISLTTTQSTNAGAGAGSGQNYFTNNPACFAGVFDPKTNSCVFGPINVTIPPTIIPTNPNQQSNNNIGITCDGSGSVTVTSINLGSNPLGIQIGQLPVTVNCGAPTPTSCPAGTTLTNGVCVAPLTCPVGSQTQNGICTGQLTCPAGTTLQNSQCIAPATCPTGSVMVNGQCQNNGIPITVPPTPTDCSILNPLACVTTTTQSEDVTVTATTSDGKIVTSTTTLTKVINPELNNVSLVIILLIIAAIIGGIIYRYLTRKPKKQSSSRHGSDKKIKDFNRNLRKS